jgi:tetratricopeptide (TPR) repeat protein
MKDRLKFVVWPKRWLYLILVIVALYIGRSLGLKGIYLLIAFAPILLLEFLLQWVVGQSLQRFDSALDSLLAADDTTGAFSLYDGQKLLHFAADKYLLLARLASISEKQGDARTAAEAYLVALEDAPRKKGAPLLNALADNLCRAGETEEAERYYWHAEQMETISPSGKANLGRLILQRKGDALIALPLLQQAVEGLPSDHNLRSELALLLAETGQPEEAKKQLAEAKTLLESSTDEPSKSYELATEALDR